MIKPNAIAVVAAMYGPTITQDTRVQHTAKPNEPPDYIRKAICNYRGLKAGELLRFCNNYKTRHYCLKVS